MKKFSRFLTFFAMILVTFCLLGILNGCKNKTETTENVDCWTSASGVTLKIQENGFLWGDKLYDYEATSYGYKIHLVSDSGQASSLDLYAFNDGDVLAADISRSYNMGSFPTRSGSFSESIVKYSDGDVKAYYNFYGDGTFLFMAGSNALDSISGTYMFHNGVLFENGKKAGTQQEWKNYSYVTENGTWLYTVFVRNVDKYKCNFAESERKQPTCTETGLVTEKCTLCGDIRLQSIPANGHDVNKTTGYCNTCQEKIQSPGLAFTYNEKTDSYRVSSGTVSDSVIYIPETYEGKPVTEISTTGFRACRNKQIHIPVSITHIGINAFYECNKSVSIKYAGTAADWCKIKFENEYSNPFYSSSCNYSFAENGVITIPDGVESISDYAFYHADTPIVVSASVRKIGTKTFDSATVKFNYNYYLWKEFGGTDEVNKLYFYYNSEKDKYTRVFYQDVIYELTDNDEYMFFEYLGNADSLTIPATLDGKAITEIGGTDTLANVKTRITFEGKIKTIHSVYDDVSNPYFSGNPNITAFRNCTAEILLPNAEIEELNGFYGYKGTSFTIPSSVLTIGEGAFMCAINLKTVVFNDKVHAIKDYAFAGCKNLNFELRIPDSVTTLGNGAFVDCAALKSVYIGLNTTYIGGYAFDGCVSLKDMTIPFVGPPEGVYYQPSPYDKHALAYLFQTDIGNNWTDVPASLTSVTILGGEIGERAFFRCENIRYIYLPDTLTEIGKSAFAYCEKLTNVVIPDRVTTINNSAFAGCTSLIGVTIPQSVTTIDYAAFRDCNSSLTITYKGSDTEWLAINKNDESLTYYKKIFTGNHTHTYVDTVHAPTCTERGFTEHLCSLCRDTYNDNYLNNIHMDLSVNERCSACNRTVYQKSSDYVLLKIDNNSLAAEFYGNSTHSLSSEIEQLYVSIYIADSVQYVYSFNNISNCQSVTLPEKLLPYIKNFENTVWYNNLRTIKNNVIYVGNVAVGLSYTERQPTHVSIREGTLAIANDCFRGENNLRSVGIPFSMKYIGSSAFYGCSRLLRVYNKSSLDIRKGSSGYGYVGYYAKDVFTSEFISNLSTDSDGFIIYTDGNTKLLLEYTGNETDIIIPEGITEIAPYAFFYCSELTSITIPDSVTSIGDYAFSDCSGLTSVTIGIGVTSIGDCAFYNCSELTTVNWNATACTSAGDYNNPIFCWCTKLSTVNIGNNVTSIPSYAFYECSGLTSITIPDSITSISSYMFSRCRGLTNITIPDSVTSIGDSAFSGCSELTSVTIHDSVTSIGDSAFSGCSELTTVNWNAIACAITRYYNNSIFYGCAKLSTVNIGNNVTSIPSYAFYNCSELTTVNWNATTCTNAGDYNKPPIFYGCAKLSTVNIGNNVTLIPSYAFSGCSGLTSITIPDSVTSIGYDAFYDCIGLTSITIPDSVTNIDNSAFYNCSGLTSVTIPDSVTSIGSSAFFNCSGLTSVTIGNSVTSIGSYAFYGCSELTTVNWNATACTSAGGYTNQPIFYGCTRLSTVNIGNNVTKIPSSAFEGCIGLTSITIPDSVTSIGSSAFSSCSGLTSVTIGNSVTSIGWGAFEHCNGLTSIYYTGDVAGWCKISGLVYIMSSSRTLYIGGNKVEGNLVIPDSVTSIGDYAFSDCSGLTSVTIGNSVTSIGEHAFYYCYKLVEVYNKSSLNIRKGSENYGKVARYAKEVYTSEYTSKLSTDSNGFIIYTDGEVKSLIGYIGSKTDIAILKEITEINHGAFYKCSKLTSITIPNSVTRIGDRAFDGCSGLTSVTIGNSVTSIGDWAFLGCSGLTSITIPNSVTRIDYSAFERCSGLTTVNWNATACTSAGNYNKPIFYGCTKLSTVNIGNNVTLIPSYAFYNCSGLTNITIPDSVTSIGIYAFGYCSSLTSVTLGNGMTSIGDYAFWDCSRLTSINYNGTKEQWQAIPKGSFWSYNTPKYVIYCTDGTIAK